MRDAHPLCVISNATPATVSCRDSRITASEVLTAANTAVTKPVIPKPPNSRNTPYGVLAGPDPPALMMTGQGVHTMTATTDTTYNGWANYETWAIKLWIDNEALRLHEWPTRHARMG